MDRLERIQAALRGEAPDRLPVSLWRHYPLDDRDAPALARRMVERQETYNFDFIKVMRERHGPLPDWGARIRSSHPPDHRAHRQGL
jgi:uroporphyrinogen decarboxylase